MGLLSELKYTSDFSFECGKVTMIIDQEEGKKLTLRRFKKEYKAFMKQVIESKREEEPLEKNFSELWKKEAENFDAGLSYGVRNRGPDFSIYKNQEHKEFWEHSRKNLKEIINNIELKFWVASTDPEPVGFSSIDKNQSVVNV